MSYIGKNPNATVVTTFMESLLNDTTALEAKQTLNVLGYKTKNITTSNYTLLASDLGSVLVKTYHGLLFLTIPSAATIGVGTFTLKNNDPTNGYILANITSGNTFDGETFLLLEPKESITVFCDGINSYIKIGQYTTLESLQGILTSGDTFTGGVFTSAINLYESNVIDVLTGNCFIKTVTGNTTFSVVNVPAFSSSVTSFTLELTNGGSYAITWWPGVTWSGGIAPTLTVSGKDILGFYSSDGGTTWNGSLVNRDVK